MADSVMFNVGPNFDFNVFADRIAQTYSAHGFAVSIADVNGSKIVKFDKNTGGINTLLGLGLGITATFTLYNGVLQINFSDAEWTSKIIGLAVGWIICFIPFITAVIGTVNQFDLPKKIGKDAGFIITQMS